VSIEFKQLQGDCILQFPYLIKPGILSAILYQSQHKIRAVNDAENARTMKKQKLFITLSYYAAFIAMGISMSSLGPTLPGLAQNTRASLSAISILFMARSLGSLVGSVWGGRIYDRVRGHGVMAVMILSMAGLTALTPYVPLLWLLTAILFLTGAAQGILNIGGNALLVWVHGREVGPFMNGLHFCFGLGTFITPVIVAQFVTQEGGLVWIYLLLAVLMLPTIAVALLPSPSSPVTGQKQNGAPASDPMLIVLIALVFGCYSGASLAYGGWIFTYATEMNLTNETNAAYLTSLFWGALTLGRLAAIPLAIRFKPQTILRFDFGGALLSLLVLLLWPRSLAAVMITSAGLGFALASIYPTTMSFAGQIMTISGKVTGLFSIGNSAGSMLVPWAIGQFFEWTGPQSLAVILLLDMVLALFVLAELRRRIALRPVLASG
jgi:MFS transporter, FHS family, Na+ dependent glucose transporter 1